MLVFCGMNPYFSACPVIVVACMMHLGVFCYVDLPVWHEPFAYSPWHSSCQNMSIDMDCIPAGVLFVGFFPTELLACIALLMFVTRQVANTFACEFDVFYRGTLTTHNRSSSLYVAPCL